MHHRNYVRIHLILKEVFDRILGQRMTNQYILFQICGVECSNSLGGSLCFAKLPVVAHTNSSRQAQLSSLDMKPQISVLKEYCFTITTCYCIFEYDCWIFEVDALPLVAAVLQAQQYLIILNSISLWMIEKTIVINWKL